MITLITGNPDKANQISAILNFQLDHQKVDLPEIQSLDLIEIIEHKAKEAYNVIKSPVLVEDTSLVFNALGGLPGPFIKWFLKELDNEGLCNLLENHEDKSAAASICFGLYDGKRLLTFEGSVPGRISSKPKGQNGFGWDPIFIPNGHDRTWAEMLPEEQNKISMRAIALKKLEAHIMEHGS